MADNLLPQPHLVLSNVSKVYEEGGQPRQVLTGVTGTIFQGEFVALVGPSGSGKSTLLNLISGIDVPSGGEVVIGNINLSRLSENKRTLFRRKNIGMVFQFFNLLPTLTVLENLLLPLELNGKSGKEGRMSAMELLEAVGLADRDKSFPDRLSGGEQQRVAIARALVHQPALVLADEPTGNLDRDTSGQVMSLLEDLSQQQGTTLVVVTHSPDVVRRADRIFTIQNGGFREQKPGNLAGRPKSPSPVAEVGP